MSVLDKFKLDGKVALVTGGNRGLGRQMALALAEAGASVAVVSRKAAEAEAAAADIEAATGQTCRGYACNVIVPEQVEALAHNVLTDFGKVNILLNNAGINTRGAIEDLTVEEFKEVQEINVTGPWLVCRAFAKHFKNRGSGRVINVGSTLSLITMPNRTPYATSKGAMLQLTRSLAIEWAPYNVTVNAILPGPFGTEMNLPLMNDAEVYKNFIAKIPLGRWGDIEEIGGIAVFLASDASSFVTGAGYLIDGGWTVH